MGQTCTVVACDRAVYSAQSTQLREPQEAEIAPEADMNHTQS